MYPFAPWNFHLEGNYTFTRHGTSSASAKVIQDILGFLVETAKHQTPNTVNVFLGVTCDVSNTASNAPYVEFRPSPGRIQRIRSMLAHESVHRISAHAAQVLLGKLNFLLHAAWGGVGRAAMQPLRSRAGQTPFLLKGGLQPPPEGTAWTLALATMASFLDLLFDRLPPCLAKKVLVCLWHSRLPRPLHGRRRHQYLLLWMAPLGFDKQTLINQCELLAILSATLSAPDLLRDRDIIAWYLS
jgi:hypothetical protein